MWTSFKERIMELDRILRGEKTRLPALREGKIDISLRGLSSIIIFLGFLYGACMGTFALLHADGPRFEQLLASTVKVPVLFFLTLLVTFPSLYVFNALVGSRLSLVAVLNLLVAALGVTLAMLAAFGPIVAFFSLSTSSYPFMVLLNVLVFAVSGLLGLKFLLQTFHRITIVQSETSDLAMPPAHSIQPDSAKNGEAVEITEIDPQGPLDDMEGYVLGRHVKTVFRCWVIVFGLVGAQMGWVLRPFIGNPDQSFSWFRARDSHFFAAVWNALVSLFN